MSYSWRKSEKHNITETNTSGCVGIHSRKYKGEHVTWRVRICLDNKRINIGDFNIFRYIR